MGEFAITMRSERGREAHPAINVKIGPFDVTALLPLELGRSRKSGETQWQVDVTPDGFSAEWVAALPESTRDVWWQFACEDGFDQAREVAREHLTWGNPQVWQEGRSGGWLVVGGVGDPEEWGEAQRAGWAAFAADVRAIADDTPRRWLWGLYTNVYDVEPDVVTAEVKDPSDPVEAHVVVTVRVGGEDVMFTIHPSKVHPDTVNVEIDGDLTAGRSLRVHLNDRLIWARRTVGGGSSGR
jgi:hypothetical protein